MINVPSGTIAGGGKAVCSVFISKDVEKLANSRVFSHSWDGAFSGVPLVDATAFQSWSGSQPISGGPGGAEVRAAGDRRTEGTTHVRAHAETLALMKGMERTPLT